jgi:predicted secreted hydrolase
MRLSFNFGGVCILKTIFKNKKVKGVTMLNKTQFKAYLISLLSIFVLLSSQLTFAKLAYHPLQFPRDEAAHFKNVPYPVKDLTEWWFYNGKLTAENGQQFGYYISYFYMQTSENGKQVVSPQFVMQLVDLKKQKTYAYGIFYPAEKAIFSTEKLDIAFGKESSLQKIDKSYVLQGIVKSRQGPTLQFSLKLTPTRDMLLASKKGMIDMWGDRNSYYYSATHLETSGTIQIGKEKFVLKPQQSLSWMDHQWGDFIVWPGLTQWMAASVQLENGLELSLNIPIDADTKKQLNKKMNIVLPNGKTIYTSQFKFVPRIAKGEKYPLQYDLIVPEINLHLALNALSPKQDENVVWEGINVAEGTYKGVPIKGQAFTENNTLID